MDLVDIDQVLDNLELREAADEHKKIVVAQRQSAAAASNGIVAAAALAKTPRSVGSNNVSSSSSGSSNKGFVGVSQVFNSLDDYCKNVESLETNAPQQYDEECRRIANTSSKETSASSCVTAAPMQTLAANPVSNAQYSNYATATAATTTQSAAQEVVNSGTRFRMETDSEDDDEEACNDIHKFTENASTRITNGLEDTEDPNTGTASDSLTTSSSSTFSSGPSPGLASTTDEHSTPLSPVEDSEERSALLANQGGEEQQYTQEQTRQQQVLVCADAEQATASLADNTNDALHLEQSGAALEDLAVGLSSISITTANSQSMLPCEATTTVSSVLQNVLEDLSETTSSSLLSQLPDGAAQPKAKPTDSRSFTTASPSYGEEDEEDDEQQPGSDNDIMPAPLQAAHALTIEKLARVQKHDISAEQQQQHQQRMQQQPITFGSTMDEISDTELDSMLQEMDIDDVPDTGSTAEKVHADEQQADATVLQTAVLPATVSTVSTTARLDEDPADLEALEELASSGADNCNADNFSQASTVEFSELKAAAAAECMQIELSEQQSEPVAREVSPVSVASSYSSTESSLDDSDLMAACAAATAGADGEAAHEDDGQCASARPQRPTTLDLPTLQMSLLANAGQTPPGGNIAARASADQQPQPESNTAGQAQNGSMLPDNAAVALSDVAEASGYSDPHVNLGKVPPIWVPDNMATDCMQCHSKFTMIKRRHHCRACGKVLCSVCCSQKYKLEFLAHPESRVCVQCYLILTQRQLHVGAEEPTALETPAAADLDALGGAAAAVVTPARSPNPNNPMEYCSTIPPLHQVSASGSQPPPAVIVPVGVLKKEGSYSSNSSNSSGKKARKRKSVMFSDGIAPGSDLASLAETRWGTVEHARRTQARGAASGNNKPSTPAKTEPSSSSSDAHTLGLVAQLFRGSIPPAAAAAAVSVASRSNSSAARSNRESTAVAATAVVPAKIAKVDVAAVGRAKRLPPAGCDENGCFIPQGDNCLPPIYVARDEHGCDYDYKELSNNFDLLERLQRETLKFALARNFYVHVKIVNLKCCMNRTVINFTTAGMHHVGNDEIVILLEYQLPASRELMSEPPLPKDIFVHLHELYTEANQGNPIAELSYSSPRQSNFLGSREYGGFIYIRATFQCLQDVCVPEQPFLIGILIHRYEVPWAKVFPLRLMLRLGAQYRYYPCPHISMRNRESVYAEIAQTIINFLADFRNYSYTLPCIRGMYIHMEDRQTTVLIPRNRQDDVIKAINNASDHILAFGGNFSKTADGHLVCMQNINDERNEMYSYSTQAINIQGQPRKVTGASFFVLNEALKSSSGLSGKCSIVEDGLMVQIMPAKMEEVRNSLRNQKDIDIVCGPLGAEEQQTEIVSIKWVENDRDFNIGVKSPIDDKAMEGISSMRVHASFNYSNANYSIRLTDIYILKYDSWYKSTTNSTSSDVTRIAEQIARSASLALVPFLDLLATSGSVKIGLRATLHQENVCYEAGARGSKLPPLYMNALDNHLIPTLHGESSGIEDAIILELIFYILSV